jgi:hypothetical protein
VNLAEAMDEGRERLGRPLRPDEMDMIARAAPRFEVALEALLDQEPPPPDEALETSAYEQRRRRVAVPGRKKPITVEEAVDITDEPPVDMGMGRGD